MNKFQIPIEYCTSVSIKEYMYSFVPTGSSEEDLMGVLNRTIIGTSTRIDDHPEFAKLRNTLEAEGYIECWRGVWNGDRVLKPFMLNDMKFKVGDKFLSGSALGIRFKLQHPIYFT